ncbi:lipoprotein (plasmid) [Mesomycoplasma hyorhinis]|uniref:P68 family surface lipoprotein n=1 Tax=Mesomycoplasma hyorhinis TaxID=2100 RepID=UPI0010051AB3|nr:lipoprotein [Mesomycoplasma hyorhinis]
MKKSFINKTKKIILATLALSPVLALISCGDTRFDQKDDNLIKLGYSFSSAGREAKAINQIISKWNSFDTDATRKASFPNYLKATQAEFQNGYGGAAQTISQKLKAKDQTSLVNLIFNYDSVLATINSYNMTLPFVLDRDNSSKNTEDQNKINNFLKQNISDIFLKNNTYIPGITTNGIYSIPMGKSSELLSIDGILLGFIINEATKASPTPATIKSEDAEFFKKYQDMAKDEKKADDITQIKKNWKEYKHFSKEEGGLGGYEFSKAAFSNYTDLIDLARRVKKSFPQAKEENNPLNSAANVMGIDSIANTVFVLSSSISEGNKENEVVSVTDKKANFTKYRDKNSNSYKNFKQIWDLLYPGIEDETILITEKGQYSSDFLKNHQLLFFTGSTAGYSHSFVEDSSAKNNKVFQLETTLKTTDNKDKKIVKNVDTRYTYELLKTSTRPQEKAIAYVKDLTKRNVLPIYLNSDLPTKPVKNSLKVDDEAGTKIKELLETDKSYWISSDKSFADFVTSNNIGNDVILKAGNQIAGRNSFSLFFINKASNKLIEKTSSSQLNEDELISLESPKKFSSKNKKFVVPLQGPNLIGIHASDKEDKATVEFVNWLLRSKEDWDANHKQLTPYEFFKVSTNYINLTNSSLSETNPKLTRGAKIAFDVLKKAKDDPNNFIIQEDAVDAKSSPFRESLLTTFNAVVNKNSSSSNKTVTFDQFLELLKQNLGPLFKK